MVEEASDAQQVRAGEGWDGDFVAYTKKVDSRTLWTKGLLKFKLYTRDDCTSYFK